MTVTAWMRKLERANGDIYVLVSGHAKKGTRERQAAEHEALISDITDEHYLSAQAVLVGSSSGCTRTISTSS
jgi:hypothetical protein